MLQFVLIDLGAFGAHYVDDSCTHLWVGQFLVGSEHRGKGIGRELWSRLIKAAIEDKNVGEQLTQKDLCGVRAIGLSTQFDHPMVSFYERNGFRFIQNNSDDKHSSWSVHILCGVHNLVFDGSV